MSKRVEVTNENLAEVLECADFEQLEIRVTLAIDLGFTASKQDYEAVQKKLGRPLKALDLIIAERENIEASSLDEYFGECENMAAIVRPTAIIKSETK